MKRIGEMLRNYLLSHEDNDHHPHLLRQIPALVLILLSVTFFSLGALRNHFVEKLSGIASVFPSTLISLSNEDREKNNLLALRENELLRQAAEMKVNDMVANGYFAHYSPTGVSPWHWVEKAGYLYKHAGENLAVNFSDSDDVVKAWMASPTHRQNILSGKYTEIGIATAKGEYKGRNTTFVVQMFGAPRDDVSGAASVLGSGEARGESVIETSDASQSFMSISYEESRFISKAADIFLEISDFFYKNLGIVYALLAFFIVIPFVHFLFSSKKQIRKKAVWRGLLLLLILLGLLLIFILEVSFPELVI